MIREKWEECGKTFVALDYSEAYLCTECIEDVEFEKMHVLEIE